MLGLKSLAIDCYNIIQTLAFEYEHHQKVSTMNNLQLETLLNQTLSPHLVKDYCPNGLQVEGKTIV